MLDVDKAKFEFSELRSNIGLGFSYIQHSPHEIIRFPTASDPIGTALLLISFVGYPRVVCMGNRREAYQAGLAWTARCARDNGSGIVVDRSLSDAVLPSRTVRNRFYKCCRRFEGDAIDVADIAANIAFEKSGSISFIGKALGHAFKADAVTLAAPREYGTTTSSIRKFLLKRRSSSALLDSDMTLRNYRKRVFNNLLPSAPLMLAVDRWCLSWDAFHECYEANIPGYKERYMAICLLRNPQLWIDSVLWFAEIWRQMLAPHFAPNTFPLLVPERVSSIAETCNF